MDIVRDLAWDYAAGRAFPEDLPMAAAEALARGADSPALRELAGLSRRSDTPEIRDLFEHALQELDIPLPTPEQAGRRDLRSLAQDLVNGRSSPREAARVCYVDAPWMNAVEGKFVGQCSYFGDMLDLIPVEHVPALEADLIASARAVLGSHAAR